MSLLKTHPLKTILAILLVVLVIFHQWFLSFLGHFLVYQQQYEQADVAVVLNTGAEIYPRLIEAADLYQHGKIKQVVINGNRKTDTLRKLEAMGYKPAQPWYEERLRILELLGVPRSEVIIISGESAYDTVSEARLVGQVLLQRGIKSVAVTTSKSHSRRAAYIWNQQFADELIIYANFARSDPYDPAGWWHDGRQIRWVLAEYGGWFFLHWKNLFSLK